MHRPRVRIAATAVVIARAERAVLVVQRRYPPHQGRFAFPGGFLETGKETLEQAAVRELAEETGVRVSAERLRLVDARSSPRRDPRAHVIDVGFVCEVARERSLPLRTREARPAWVPVRAAGRLRFAFDHRELWNAARHMSRCSFKGRPKA